MVKKVKVADYIIDKLGLAGVKDIFEVYGAANGDLIDGFTRTKNTRYISVMHEQAGGFAAECYAKINGNLAAAIATSGPGGHNFVTPIANCYYDSVPCIFLTGQVQSRFMRVDSRIRQSGFQETPIAEIVKPITKYASLVTKPELVKSELEKAIFIAKAGRPGPVLLDLPIDVQKAVIDLDCCPSFNSAGYSFNQNLSAVDKTIDSFLKDFREAKRPAMLIGAGVRLSGGLEDFFKAADILKIPCFPTWNALDIVTSDFEYYGGRIGSYGGDGRNFGIQNSDLILSIGSRVSGRLTGSKSNTFLRAAKKYMVDIDPAVLEKKFQQVQFDETLHCDAKQFLGRLCERLEKEKIKDFSEWSKKVYNWRDKYDPVLKEYYNEKGVVNPYVFIRVLSEEMEKGDILVGDCGGNIVVASQGFKTKKRQRFLTNNGNSPMGFSFAGAMGAWLASDRSPNKANNVVCTIGDGGFNMNIQELQTVKNYDLRFKTFIMNNHCYGITRQFQRTNFEGRMEACGPAGYNPPNFVDICNAYGIKTVTIKSPDNLRSKIREMLTRDEPIVCDVNMHDWDNYSPRVFGGAPIEDMQPFLDRKEFRKNMIIPPIEGWQDASYKRKK